MTESHIVSIDRPTRLAMPREDEAIAVRRKDWNRLRRRLVSIEGQRREFSGAAWACVGITVSSVFAGIAWDPAYRSMPNNLRPDAAWVWPTIIILGIASLVLAAAMFWFSRMARGSERASIAEVLEDMDDIAGVE